MSPTDELHPAGRPGPTRCLQRHRRAGIVVAAIVSHAFATAPVTATPKPTVGSEKGCTVVVAAPIVPHENVAYLVAEPFTLTREPTGEVRLNLNVIRCSELRIGDSVRDTVYAVLGVGLDCVHDSLCPSGSAPADPDRAPQSPLPLHLDDYRFWYLSNNPDFVELLKRDGGLGSNAVFVDNIEYRLTWDATGTAAEFFFRAPEPARFAFTIDAEVTAATVGPVDLSAHHYHATSRGWTVANGPDGLHGEPDTLMGLRLGGASGKVTPGPDSELHQLFCDDTDGSFADPAAGHVTFEEGTGFTVAVDPATPGFKAPPAQCPAP